MGSTSRLDRVVAGQTSSNSAHARGGVNSLLRGSSGAAVAEHAIILAFVVGGITLVAGSLGFAVCESLAGTGAGWKTAGPTLALAGRNLPAAGQPALQAMPTTSTAPASPLVGLLTLAGLLPVGLGLWHVFARRRKSADEELNEKVAAALDAELNHDVVFEKRQGIFNIMAADMHALFESRLEARHLMSRRLTTVPQNTPAEEVQRVMQEKRLRHLLVCDADNRLLGIISDRDLLRAGGGTAATMMTREPVTVQLNTQINPAVTLLIQRRISCVPVLDGERLCGVLTTTDLLMALQCTLQMLKKIAAEISPSA